MANEVILIVDDNAANLKLARVVLEDEGYVVRTAIDAPDVMRVLEESQPRLILMDIQLPGVDGLELTRRLKADSRYQHIVIVALTAYAMKGDRAKALTAGCDGYITKPIDVDELPKTVAQHLAGMKPG
ncbi:MAG TPA: response regulator [Kofleriaceae bacterium]